MRRETGRRCMLEVDHGEVGGVSGPRDHTMAVVVPRQQVSRTRSAWVITLSSELEMLDDREEARCLSAVEVLIGTFSGLPIRIFDVGSKPPSHGIRGSLPCKLAFQTSGHFVCLESVR